MKRMALILLALLLVAGAQAQQLPQFVYNDYEGWIYNNPGVELSSETIGQARVRLYIDSQGLVITLTSPEFSCQGLDSIHADVKWKSASQSIALTMVLDDVDGTPLDSVSCSPTSSYSDQDLAFTLAVPSGLSAARVRFVSWDAVVSTAGAVRRVLLEGITAPGEEQTIIGDVDGNGSIAISDVTSLIAFLLNNSVAIQQEAADVNQDGRITIGDVTALIQLLLSGK